MIDLHGRTAMVAGLEGKVQTEVTHALCKAGARCVMAHCEDTQVDSLPLEHAGASHVRTIRFDPRSAAGYTALAAAEPRADILIVGGAARGLQDFFAASDETWRLFFEANLMSRVRLARGYMAGMAERGWGRVLFVSAPVRERPDCDEIHGDVLNAAQLALVPNLAALGAETGVAVNALTLPAPGRRRNEGDTAQALVELTLFLCSEDGVAHSGTTIPVTRAAARSLRPPPRLVWSA